MINGTLFAQKDKNNIHINNWELISGADFLTLKNHINHKSPLFYSGLQKSNYYLGLGPRKYLINLSFSTIYPLKNVVIDSTNYKLSGFDFSFTFLGYDFIKKNENIVLSINMGFSSGRLKLNHDNTSVQNPFFSPKIMLFNSYRINRININVFGSYFYDISKTSWTNTFFYKNDPNKSNIDNFNFTGYNVGIGLGYYF